MNLYVTPIAQVREHNPEGDKNQRRKALVDLKVYGLVPNLISKGKQGLFPSVSSPKIVIDVMPSLKNAAFEHIPKEKGKATRRKISLGQRAPLGLCPVDEEGCLNALMQFILFVPTLVEHFFFAPKSFLPFQAFIDQYHLDQNDNRGFARANGNKIYQFLYENLFSFSLHEIFSFILRALQPEQKIHMSIDEALKEKGASDLFIAESCLKRQFFTEKELFCYDLNAFIELRPDMTRVYFIAYVKVDGTWYQCDDDRIVQLRSSSLKLALTRAVLLHYKKIEFRSLS